MCWKMLVATWLQSHAMLVTHARLVRHVGMGAILGNHHGHVLLLGHHGYVGLLPLPLACKLVTCAKS